MATTQTKTQQLKWADNALTTTTAQASQSIVPWGDSFTVQAVCTGTGAVTVNVPVEVSNDGTNWITADTIALTGTAPQTDGVAVTARWGFIRAGTLTSLSGTGVTVSLFVAGAGA